MRDVKLFDADFQLLKWFDSEDPQSLEAVVEELRTQLNPIRQQ